MFTDIAEFPGYQINTNGEIYNVRSNRILKSAICKDRQVRIGLRKDGVSFNRSIHRMLAITFIPNPRELWFVKHLDGDRTNNKLTNLKWVN